MRLRRKGPWNDRREGARRGFWLSIAAAVLVAVLSNAVQALAQEIWKQDTRDYWIGYARGLAQWYCGIH